MAVYEDREAFIPYRRADVIELCIKDGKLNKEDEQKFREFCEILSAYYHFEFHKSLETLKDNFAPFDPDADTKPMVHPTPEQQKEMEKKLMDEFENILKKANYSPLTDEEWKKALEEESLITLNMDIDFDDFERWILYHRGDTQKTIQIKKFFRTVDFTMDVYERVVLFLKFKDEEYFKQKGKDISKLNFTPGKMYIYLYKDIPKADLEILFPNVEISMNLKDKLLFFIPAIGAGLFSLIKVLPNLLLLIGFIFYLIFGPVWIAQKLGVSKETVQNATAIIAVAASTIAVLGGYAARQYIKYKNKRLQFMKQVTDTLFFRNLVCNMGVFHNLIDAAEEEECKEIILAYYHLLTSEKDLNQEQLDDLIEEWLEKKFDTKIDFDVDKALAKLENLKGKVVKEGEKEEEVPEVPLMKRDEKGICKVLPLDDAKILIDYVWDNIFQYNIALE